MRLKIITICFLSFIISCQEDDKTEILSKIQEIDSLNTELLTKNKKLDSLIEQNAKLIKTIDQLVYDPNSFYFKFAQNDSIVLKESIPTEVLRYIAINYPDYELPLWKWFIYKNYNQLPYFAKGDFNNDNHIDYIIHIGKRKVSKSKPYKPYWENIYVLLHGSEKGLIEIPSGLNRSGGYIKENGIEESLMSKTYDELEKEYPFIKKSNIKNTSILIKSPTSVLCIYWYNNKYNNTLLFAD